MSILDVYAGANALRVIRQNGFHQDLFDYVLGASGGPKWFVLAGLDRVIAPTFFAGRKTPLHVIGSSAGAFRAACYAQSDPLSAINRLADNYATTVYSSNPKPKEITQKGLGLLNVMLEENGIEQILYNPIVKAHFIVARSRGLTSIEKKPLQLAGLIASAGANLMKRKWLQGFYQRYLFSVPDAEVSISCVDGLRTHYVKLSQHNLVQALMASGSIPLILEGVNDIVGAPAGVYRDGGIIDYHFNLSFGELPGLVLYPHFYSRPVPGWFDKALKHRNAHYSSYDNVVMLVPSNDFIASLPYGKIPDRKDFEAMPEQQRIPYWQKVLKESDRLGEAFMKFVESDNAVANIKPIVLKR